jgi:hypothetical protein
VAGGQISAVRYQPAREQAGHRSESCEGKTSKTRGKRIFPKREGLYFSGFRSASLARGCGDDMFSRKLRGFSWGSFFRCGRFSAWGVGKEQWSVVGA